MAIVVTCPRCDRKYSLADTMAGRRVTCKGCTQEFGVPGCSASSSPSKTKASAWDDDDGGEIAFAAPPPRQVYEEPTKSKSDDDDFRPPPRVKARTSSGSKSKKSDTSWTWGFHGSTTMMVRSIVAVVVAIVAFLSGRGYLSDAGNTPHAHDAVALIQEYAALLNEGSGLLEQGADAESFERLQVRVNEVQTRIRGAGDVTVAEERYIKREVGPTMREALTRTKLAFKKLEADPILAIRLSLANVQLDKELKAWGGPSREIPSNPPPAAPSVELAAPLATPIAAEPAIPADTDDVTRSLLELKSANFIKRKDALIRLQQATPDGRADEVVSAAISQFVGSDRNSSVATEAVKVLGTWPNRAGISMLCGLVSDENILIRYEAMAALAKSLDPSGIEPIIGRLPKEQQEATKALVIYGPAAEAPLIARLTDADPRVRGTACDALAKLGGKDTLTAMKDLPPDEHPAIRDHAKLAWDEIVKRVGPLPEEAKPKTTKKATGKTKR